MPVARSTFVAHRTPPEQIVASYGAVYRPSWQTVANGPGVVAAPSRTARFDGRSTPRIPPLLEPSPQFGPTTWQQGGSQ